MWTQIEQAFSPWAQPHAASRPLAYTIGLIPWLMKPVEFHISVWHAFVIVAGEYPRPRFFEPEERASYKIAYAEILTALAAPPLQAWPDPTTNPNPNPPPQACFYSIVYVEIATLQEHARVEEAVCSREYDAAWLPQHADPVSPRRSRYDDLDEPGMDFALGVGVSSIFAALGLSTAAIDRGD